MRRPDAGRSRRPSGREFLAAPRPPRGDHLATADRRHAGAKAMTALAHELRGLIGPLHRLISEFGFAYGKIGRCPRSSRANTNAAARCDGRRVGKTNAALHAPPSRAYASPGG